jgi:hypothetical protein
MIDSRTAESVYRYFHPPESEVESASIEQEPQA